MNTAAESTLNPTLYEFLCQHTGGKVEIQNNGRNLQYEIVQNGKWRSVHCISGGEEYVINCPICRDTRGRCYVNHTFGTRIEGVPVYHLIHCFNEGCDHEVSKWLREEMKAWEKDNGYVPTVDRVTPARVSAFDPAKTAREAFDFYVANRLPVVSLSNLSPEHPVSIYISSRGLDMKYLSEIFGVGIFDGFPHKYSMAKTRLIVSVYFSGIPVGWTARVVPGYTVSEKWRHNELPKYINSPGFRKSMFLYNYDRAKDAPVIAVAEGVTDVWKIGTWGMGLFGKSMSDAQCQLLCRAGEDKGAAFVLLADASTEKDDAAKSWRKNYEKLRDTYRYPDRVFLHHMAQGDPGDCSPQELHELVTNIVHGK